MWLAREVTPGVGDGKPGFVGHRHRPGERELPHVDVLESRIPIDLPGPEYEIVDDEERIGAVRQSHLQRAVSGLEGERFEAVPGQGDLHLLCVVVRVSAESRTTTQRRCRSP